MEKYKLGDWRYPPQIRQNKRAASEDGLYKCSLYGQEQEETSAQEDLEQPPYTYSELATMAIKNSPEMRCTAHEIAHFILNHYPYYREREKKWEREKKRLSGIVSSIRSTLSVRKGDFFKTKYYKIGGSGRRNYYFTITGDIIQN